MADTSSPGAAAGSAMQRAVLAERDARDAIAEAEATAAAAVEAARAQARAILKAVPDRITRLRARGARTVQRALTDLQAREAAATAALGTTALPGDLLGPTTDALATRLTGGEPGASR